MGAFRIWRGFGRRSSDEAGNLIVGGSAEGGWPLHNGGGLEALGRMEAPTAFWPSTTASGGLLACTSTGAPVGSLALASDGTVVAGGTGWEAEDTHTRSMIEGPFDDSWFGRYSVDFSHLLFSSYVGGLLVRK